MKLHQAIEVCINSNTKTYWEEKGYSGKCGTKILVVSDELPDNSHTIEERECDCCHKIYSNTHQKLNRSYKSFGADYCPDCVAQNKEIALIKKNKSIQTSIDKYGVESPNQSELVKHNKEISSLTKYGVTSTNKLPEVKKKIKETFLKNYGVSHPAKTKEFHEKIHNTMLRNGTTPTSAPQLKIFELLKNKYSEAEVTMNYPLSELMLDISIVFKDGNKIDIEYDGWYWHQDKQKDFKRDMFVESQGYKVIRIKSADSIPNEEVLVDMISDMIKYNRQYSSIILNDWREL